MLRYCKVFCVVLSCIAVSLSQETRFSSDYNSSYNSFRLNNRAPENDQSEEPNLWLISRDDPVPASLNGLILTRNYISNGQISSVQSSDYGKRLSRPTSDGNIESVPGLQQSVNTYISQTPVTYDRIVSSENRRQSADGNDPGIPNSEAVLVQLPVELTEGLWVRPQYQNYQQPYVRGRQNADGQGANIQFDEFVRPEEQVAKVQIRELTSHVPNNEFSSQGELNAPQEQYHGPPYQTVTQHFEAPNGINASTSAEAHPDSNVPKIWLLNREQNIFSDNNTSARLYEIPSIDASPRNTQVHEIGILTNEDIELLERLGILSSLIIEPIQTANITDRFAAIENPQREYESDPVLIDNGGQIFSENSGRESANLADVVLFDIPDFTTSGYHTDIPENVGNREDRQSPEIYQSGNVSEDRLKLNESSNAQNDTNLTYRQILEILQILSINTEDLFNLSASVPTRIESIESEDLKYDNSSKVKDQQSFNSSAFFNTNVSLTGPEAVVPTSTLPTVIKEPQQTVQEQFNFASPSVSNGRIQPRLLEKLTQKENEIIQQLFTKAIPVSESKMELLRKLQDQPKPYNFGFKQDDGNGTLQHRNEKSDASGVVKGTYGYRDALGVYRNVSYIADSNGFHAVVKTNEPGTVSHNTADVVFMSQTPPLGALIKMMAYRRSKEALNATRAP